MLTDTLIPSSASKFRLLVPRPAMMVPTHDDNGAEAYIRRPVRPLDVLPTKSGFHRDLLVVCLSNGHGDSVVARHERNGLLKMPGALEDLVEKRRLESQESVESESQRRMPGHLDSDEESVPDPGPIGHPNSSRFHPTTGI